MASIAARCRGVIRRRIRDGRRSGARHRTCGLDPATASEFLSKIRELRDQGEVTVILVSHDMETVAQLADRIYVITQGRTVLEGTPQQIFSQFAPLRSYGLDAPQVTQVMHGLRHRGRKVRVDLLSVSEAEEEIGRCFDLSQRLAETAT